MPCLTALALTLCAGTATLASGQTMPMHPSATATIPHAVDFRSARWLDSRDVINNNGENVATASDFIIDRGSGRIQYIVIKTGTTFGMGGRAIVIPFSSFRWDSTKDVFVLASTAEQLKQYPEYTVESWKAMKEASRDDKNTLRQMLAADSAAANDPYAVSLDTAKTERISGEVVDVRRVRTSTFGEQIEVTVLVAGGGSKKIALGPSWYVNGSAAAPMRGESVAVDTLAMQRDPEQLLAGTEFHNGKNDLHLRGSDGTPVWALKSVDSGGQSYSPPYSRYMVMSNLKGMKIDCRGNECGKVYDIIVDRNSGEVGFISIDPNQNFLGLGDTKRLVPWSVATVTFEGTMRIDASKEMVLASPETPSDLTMLNAGTHAERVYKAFNVPAPRFEALPPISMNQPGSGGAWTAKGSVCSSIERDMAMTFEGKVVDISEVRFENGIPAARAVKIRVQGESGNEQVVLLGPCTYLDNQKAMCLSGDSIKVEACRTHVGSQVFWIARSVECKEIRVVLLDGNNVPEWAQP